MDIVRAECSGTTYFLNPNLSDGRVIIMDTVPMNDHDFALAVRKLVDGDDNDTALGKLALFIRQKIADRTPDAVVVEDVSNGRD